MLNEFLVPMGISQRQFATHLGWTYARINEIINACRDVTAESALAFGKALGTGPELWLNLRRTWDLCHSMRSHRKIQPLR